MAGLLDLFSGRSSDIYGNGLLTSEQRGGLGNIGLLALAGKLGQLAGPSFSPVPDFGVALGQAAGAYGASQEGAGTAALNAILTGQKGQKLQQELDYYKQLGPILSKLGGQWPGADGGTAATAETGSTGGGTAVPLGAGGGGPGSDPRGMIPHITAEATRLGIDPAVALQVARSEGLGIFSGDKGKSGGAFQLYTGGGMGNDFIRDTGLDPLDPKNEKATITYALEQAAQKGWGAWNGAKKLGITGFAGIGKPGGAPTAAAAPAGGGGLLATAPNPLSDAEPMVPIARPAAPGVGAAAVAPNQIGRFAGIAPGTPVNSGGFPYNPEITDPAVAARVAQSMAAIKQAQQSGVPWAAPRVSGGGLLAPEDPGAGYGGGPPQGPAGDIGQAGPAGPATPRAPLPAMGPAGIELPPMQGPLAAPAPAAAAPAAPGPGLLSPPGAPAAALPRVNPAYDAFLRNAGLAGALAKGAGLTDVLGPLTEALTKSPSYQAALETARKAAGLPFIGPEETAKRTAGLPFIGPETTARAGAEQPFLLQRDAFKNALDNLANGRIYDETTGSFKSVPGFSRTLADQEQAKAVGSKSQDTTEVTVRGADGRDYKQLIPQTDLAQKLREQPPAIPGQPVPPGTIVGSRQTGPLDTLGVDTLKEAGVAAQGAYKRMQDYGQLAQAAQGFTTGPTTEKWFEVKRYLKDAGIISGTEVPDQEIFQLAQKRLQAAAAPKGQGSTSDYERSLFSSGLASMATSREGLARAIAIANRLDQYDVQVAQIHEDVARQNRGYPDYLAVQQRLRELGPPLSEGEKAALMAVSSGTAGTAPAAAAAPAAPVARRWNPAANGGRGGLE